jgi:hypothetical protein
MKLPKQTWQERFDKEFPNARNIFQDGDPNDIRRKSIKSFIAKILEEEKRRLVGEIEKELNKIYQLDYDGFLNKCYMLIVKRYKQSN